MNAPAKREAKRVKPRLQPKEFAVIVTAACSSAACADADMPDFFFNGFGVSGVVHSSEQQADFASSYLYFQPGGVGCTDDWSAAVDGSVGAQLAVNFIVQRVAVAQAIAEKNYDNTFRRLPVEWADIKYEFTPDFSVRLGRIALLIDFVF